MPDHAHEPIAHAAAGRLLQRSALGLGALGLAGLLGDQRRTRASSEGGGRRRPGREVARISRARRSGSSTSSSTAGRRTSTRSTPSRPWRSTPASRCRRTCRTERKTGAAFPSPFKFQKYGQSGIEVSELFAKTAQHVDDIAVIRSMYAQVPNHEPSLMLMNCGDSVQPRPSVGSWVLYGLGTENQNLPGFIAMCPGGYPIKDAENWQSGFLPGRLPGHVHRPAAHASSTS